MGRQEYSLHTEPFVRLNVRKQFVGIIALALVCTSLSTSAFAVRHTARVRHSHLRWLRMESDVPALARILNIQNAEIDRLELPRIQDDTELEALKADGSLLEIVPNESLRSNQHSTLRGVIAARGR